MKNKTILLTIMAILALTTLACGFTFNLPNTVEGNGNIEQESRSIESFDKIELNGIGNIYVEIGEEPTLEISAEENLLEYIETYNRGETLVIEIKDRANIMPTEPVDFYITATSLSSVDVSGLADVQLPAIEADRFSITISGAGDIDMDELVAESLNVELGGLGSFTINGGEVEQQDVVISGSGSFNSRRMDSQEADINISGLGSATVSVSDMLDVNISGGGSVNYYGSPEVKSNISGLGDLDKIGD